MKKILIIDDSTNITDLLSIVLKKRNFEIKVAQTGKRGIELLNKEDFDLLIIDIILPDCNGLELLEEIKAKKPKLPTIILSAHGDFKYDFKSWVGDIFITKTSNLINDILTSIEKFL